MATNYATTNYAQAQPAGTGHGFYKNVTNLHAASGTITFALNDTVSFGYLPVNAIVTDVIIKAPTQLDSATSLTIDLGVTGATTQFFSATSVVGRASGASFASVRAKDTGYTAGGLFYKNTTGSKLIVLATIHAAAGTAVAGTLELGLEYYVEDTVGSNP